MAKPYKENGAWSFRLRINDEDVYKGGIETQAQARREADEQRVKLKASREPAHAGPGRTSLGQALLDYGVARLPGMQGGDQEARRINRFLRLQGLPTLKLTPADEQAHVTEQSAVHWVVTQVPQAVPRKIPQGLTENRQRLAERGQRSDELRRSLAGKLVGKIQPNDIQQLIDQLVREGKGASTIRLEIAVLRQLFSYAIDTWKWGLRDGNPAANRKLPKIDNERDRVLSNNEWQRIEEALVFTRNTDVAPALALLLETSMRSGEALVRATWGDFDAQRCILRLRKSKTGWRNVPLGPGAMMVLEQLQEHAPQPVNPADRILPLTYESLKAAWNRVCERAGVHGVKLHDLRHTAATRYCMEFNGNMPLLKLITGHKTDKMLLRYINLKVDDAVRQMHGRPADEGSAPAKLKIPGPKMVCEKKSDGPWIGEKIPSNVVLFTGKKAGRNAA